MRIAHVTHRAWPVVGGSERYVHAIASRQAREGHDVAVIASDACDLDALWDRRGRRIEDGAANEIDGVRIHRLAVRHLPLGGISFAMLRRLSWAPGGRPGAISRRLDHIHPWLPGLPAALRDEAPDLLFAWNVTLVGLTAAVASYAVPRRVPWIAIPLLHLGLPRFYTTPHQMALIRHAQAVLAQTESERQALIAGGLDGERLHVTGPGVDLSEAASADGKRFRAARDLGSPIVLALGPPARDKGAPFVLRAMERLWNHGADATLVFVGPGTAEFVRRRGVPKRYGTRLLGLGIISEAEKWDAVDAADVLVLPSRTESFGVVYLEAWARATPVVGARAGAVTDVIDDGVDGLLVPFGRVRPLAEAIQVLLDHPARAEQMGRRGQDKVVRCYQWKQRYARVHGVVESIC